MKIRYHFVLYLYVIVPLDRKVLLQHFFQAYLNYGLLKITFKHTSNHDTITPTPRTGVKIVRYPTM